MTCPLPSGRARPSRRIEARLDFRAVRGVTHLGGQLTPHPFHITRVFRLAGDPEGMATLYLQSSSGGLYGDDDLRLRVGAGPGSAVHLTTQASSVVHHARGGAARQWVTIEAGAGALVEYCPEPAILFAGARLAADLDTRLGDGARVVLTDAALPHDPDGQGAPFDRLRARLRITGPDGRPLLIDRIEVPGADWLARTAGHPCHGVLLAAGLGAEEAPAVGAALRAALEAEPGGPVLAGATVLSGRGIALARILARDGASLSAALTRGWAALRTAMTGRPASPRRK